MYDAPPSAHGRLIEAAQKLANATLGEWSPEQQAECERLHRKVGDLLGEMASAAT